MDQLITASSARPADTVIACLALKRKLMSLSIPAAGKAKALGTCSTGWSAKTALLGGALERIAPGSAQCWAQPGAALPLSDTDYRRTDGLDRSRAAGLFGNLDALYDRGRLWRDVAGRHTASLDGVRRCRGQGQPGLGCMAAPTQNED